MVLRSANFLDAKIHKTPYLSKHDIRVFQLYQGLDIVTNKPTQEELALCQHHLVNFVSPLERNYTVIEYSRTALPIISILGGFESHHFMGSCTILWQVF